MKKSNETQIVGVCLTGLQCLGAFAWRNNTGGVLRQNSKGQKRFIAFGTKGAPDIVAVLGGYFIGVECKMPGNSQSLDQATWQLNCEAAGGAYWVVTSLDELLSRATAFCAEKKIFNRLGLSGA